MTSSTEPPSSGAGSPPGEAQFGEAAAEMANETEVEGPDPGPAGASDDISDLDWVVEDEAASGTGDEADQADQADTLDQQLVERTADLQRLQAEFLNYKRRVDRDRGLIAENATYKVLQPIVEVLDTIDRAREHGELEGGFKSVSDQLERVVAGLGLTKFGAPGDAFDPTVHEALSHLGEDPDVTVTTAKVIAKSGYKINNRVVRAAQVLVVDPETPTA